MRCLPLVILVATLFPSWTFADEPCTRGLEFFEKRIRPLLSDNCFKCHTGDKRKGNLALNSRETILKGGDTGPAVIPGEPGKSLLMKAIGYAEPELRMPPRGKLNDQQVADVAEWIKLGALGLPTPGPSPLSKRISISRNAAATGRFCPWGPILLSLLKTRPG